MPVRRSTVRPPVRFVRHLHVHRHTVTHTWPRGLGVADTYSAIPGMAAPAAPQAIPAAAERWPVLPPRPPGFWPRLRWEARRVWRVVRYIFWPLALTVLDFVLRRTTVGFLIRPMDRA